jgi:DNA-binding NtrC family response regulator
MSVREYLRAMSVEILEAALPSEALARAAALGRPIDLCITDVVLPEMSGPELARKLQARHPSLRTLYMSTFTHQELAGPGMIDEDAPLLRKPFVKEDLEDALAEVLRQRRGILIVEDDQTAREALTLLLQGHGFDVLEAADPAKALELARQHAGAIQVLVTDLRLPTMRGDELAGQLHKLLPDLRVVFMSGLPEARTGMGPCLQKPVEVDALLAAIDLSVRKEPRDRS